MNTIGQKFRFTSFGESHGPAIGGVIDGMPAGIKIDLDEVQRQLDRRRPGQSNITTARSEADRVEVLSGLFEGRTTGTPIGFIIRNTDHRSSDYSEIARTFRPSHADLTYQLKYGIRDYRGGGRSSARETATRVVAGAFAAQALAERGIRCYAWTSQVGDIRLDDDNIDPALIDTNAVRCPDAAVAARMQALIEQVKAEGDTIGGIISARVTGMPAGIGDPVFGKLHACLAAAMMSINAAKGFEYGMGFEGCCRRGSEMIDELLPADADHPIPYSTTNHSGGIQGGISNGMDICFRVAFKPVATLLRPVNTVDVDNRAATLTARGRHDPCVLPRAVPVVEAMACITLLDALL